MVVARPRRPQRVRPCPLPQRADRPRRRHARQRLDELGDVRPGQPEVAVAALRGHGHQPRADELAEVPAGRRRRHARLGRQHAGRQRAAVAEREQHPRPRTVREHAADGREIGVTGHTRQARTGTFRGRPKRSDPTLVTMRRDYTAVLAAAACCYAALGAVLRILPDLVDDKAVLGLAVGAPAVTALLTRPAGGRLADHAGPRRVLLAGAAVMAAGMAPVLVSDATGPLVASRLLAGAGEGAMMAAAVLWLLRLAGDERRGRALGHIGLANYAGLAAGPLPACAPGADARVSAAAAALPLCVAAGVSARPAPPPPPTSAMRA